MNQRFIITAYTIFSFAGHPACRWALPFGAGASSRACSHPEGLSSPGKSKKRAPLELERTVVSYSRNTVRFRWRFVPVCKRKAQAKYFQVFQMFSWGKAVPALVLQGRAWKQEGSPRLQNLIPPATRSCSTAGEPTPALEQSIPGGWGWATSAHKVPPRAKGRHWRLDAAGHGAELPQRARLLPEPGPFTCRATQPRA